MFLLKEEFYDIARLELVESAVCNIPMTKSGLKSMMKEKYMNFFACNVNSKQHLQENLRKKLENPF